MSIPMVDFGACSLSEEEVGDEQKMHALGKQLESTFTGVGFVCLKNTGITQEEVNAVMAVSKTFFLQPEEEKKPFSRKSFADNPNHGWVQLETERTNRACPADLKESFNVTLIRPDIEWPSGAVEGFQEIQTTFFRRCKELSLRVLRVMALSLGLDPQVFLSAHRFIGAEGNNSTLRSLYYPPVNRETVKEDQVRCGEHSDYSSITLLFSTSEGLQVQRRSGEFMDVPYVPGTVLINIADIMQRWTSDRFVSVVHRVLLPPAGDSSTRQSLAFLLQPDDEALITCCDGSNRYPPITGGDYLAERFSRTY
ncbi:uncharacterized protein LOC130194672 isoform X2 [Pseudoliparis swirei]|uniref:uncharacterized protein LOC130194672 isoform X2 n=1 Tax=Pseudoliparis swirei TaxID=2059687 RepID=UPI0024BD968D|nr:uncharacterized protein LOC130194672 isoform X2 [Pseudoliparis swirei]